MRIFLLATALLAASLTGSRAADTPEAAPKDLAAPASTPRLSTSAAVILGLVEGITEFLPISSTGHLIIANDLLGLESELPLSSADGKPMWYVKPSPKDPEGKPLTLKLAADTYAVIIQVGAIAAVVILYWSQLLKMLRGLTGRDPDGLLFLRNIICAVIPVVIIGKLAHDWVDEHLFSVQAVIVAQISGAVLMLAVERWRRSRSALSQGGKEPRDLSIAEATSIGFMQCLALWPGMSRSMVTIVGGYFAGLSPARAAEFSFLVGLPVLAGAALLKGLKSGPAMIAVFGWEHVLLGIVVAAISAAIAVKLLVGFLSRHGLFAFALYRIALATLLAVWFLRFSA